MVSLNFCPPINSGIKGKNNPYNARPTRLELVQKKLDEAVFSAYGWPSDLSDVEILERLLRLNLERAGEEVNLMGNNN